MAIMSKRIGSDAGKAIFIVSGTKEKQGQKVVHKNVS